MLPGLVVAVLGLAVLGWIFRPPPAPKLSARAASGGVDFPSTAVPFAILGDSDSHSYRDVLLLPQGRGGAFRETSYQWPEVLARVRPTAFDFGGWGVWGDGLRAAKLKDLVGLTSRAPRKEDYRFNFAWSGARCADLNHGTERQVQRLVQELQLNPQRWKTGVVLIRIGVNDIGQEEHLGHFASGGGLETVDACVAELKTAVAAIRAASPGVRLVLVGIFDNTNWARLGSKWQSPGELANISRALNRYDDGVRALVADNAPALFVDDRAWFEQRFGGRDTTGKPAWRALSLGGPTVIENTEGDHPKNLSLSDGHAGTVWNLLWAAALVEALNQKWDLKIEPFTQDEIAAFADPAKKFGLRP